MTLLPPYEPGKCWSFHPDRPDRAGFFIRPPDPHDPDRRDRAWLSIGLSRAESRWDRRALTRAQRLQAIPHIHDEMLSRLEQLSLL